MIREEAINGLRKIEKCRSKEDCPVAFGKLECDGCEYETDLDELADAVLFIAGRNGTLQVEGTEDFHRLCRMELVKSYNSKPFVKQKIEYENTYVVWSCRILQNYKALLSTDVYGDNVYAEYTYNGDKLELYEDFYLKDSNRVINS